MKHSSLLKELKDFLLLWASQAVSSLGTAMTEYALVIWAYQQQGSAASVTTLTLCSFLPTILFRFIAGAMADRWNKKRIMLCADLFAACGTLAVLVLHSLGELRLWHLYVINILLSFMNAFQSPAAFAATSMLVPEKHYAKAGGLQGISGAVISILSPALGSVLLAFGGLQVVLAVDLASFAVAWMVLFLFIRIPHAPCAGGKKGESFLKSCMAGMRYLKNHKALLKITLFIAATNFLAKLGNDGMLAPFVLARTGNRQEALGLVQSAVSAGLLAGSFAVTVMKPVKRKTRLIFAAYTLIFAFGAVQSLSRQVWVWAATAFGTYLLAAVMNANLTVLIRAYVPIDMHGRVFSAKDTLQNGTIPLALAIGGPLADRVFEPFVAGESLLCSALKGIFGTGNGAGIAVMFFLVSTLGTAYSLAQMRKPVYRELER